MDRLPAAVERWLGVSLICGSLLLLLGFDVYEVYFHEKLCHTVFSSDDQWLLKHYAGTGQTPADAPGSKASPDKGSSNSSAPAKSPSEGPRKAKTWDWQSYRPWS